MWESGWGLIYYYTDLHLISSSLVQDLMPAFLCAWCFSVWSLNDLLFLKQIPPSFQRCRKEAVIWCCRLEWTLESTNFIYRLSNTCFPPPPNLHLLLFSMLPIVETFLKSSEVNWFTFYHVITTPTSTRVTWIWPIFSLLRFS